MNGVGYESDRVLQIETNLDDLSPELVGHVTGLLLAAGALDVWTTAIQMKKQRPGMLLSVLCALDEAEKFAGMIFQHTSAFGVRMTETLRWKLRRDFVKVATRFGDITVKRGFHGERLLQIAPEYESCRVAAETHGCPLQHVYDAARAAAQPSG
jgi:hypothetical protein